jgi:hypothetical protein
VKRLLIDIETAPNLAHVWGMFNQNIAPKQIQATGYTLCWAAKWYGKKGVLFDSRHQSSETDMIRRVWELLNEADAVIHYNGSRFDIPTLNKEFLKAGLTPPEPYKQVDLLRTVRARFRFHSNKLDEVLKQLGMEAKVQHKGHELWTECMAGDPKAWKVMERYNRRDVTIMEGLYTRLLPWIKNHPNFGLYVNENRPVCTKCGGHELQKRGLQRSQVAVYDRYQCQECGSWQQERRMTPLRNQGWILKEAH